MPINTMEGVEQFGAERSVNLIVGYTDTAFLNASAGDATPADTFLNCRFISVDVTGIVKIDYVNASGTAVTEVKILNGGTVYGIRNVKKLYQYYVGATDGTAQSYTNAGVLVTNAIKIHR